MKMPGFKIAGLVVAALLLTIPSAALAARGIVTTAVSMRAGPGIGFPVVDRIPGGARVNIHGCLRDNSWCDVSWDGDRGWVSAEYLEYFYRNRYVYLPDYVDVIDVPVVPFVLTSYWSNYYASRPFFHRRAYWNNYWQSNARFATRAPRGSSRFATTQGRGPQARFANERGARFSSERLRSERFSSQRSSERMARVNGRREAISSTRQPFSATQRGTRFSTAPMSGPSARHDLGRGRDFARGREFGRVGAAGRAGGPPVQAHGQFAGPRAGGVPNAGPGGGARFSGSPMNSPVARPNVGHVSGPPMQAHGQIGGGPRAMGGGMPNAGGGARIGGGPPAGAAPAAAAHGGGGGGPAGGPPGRGHGR
jgi:uncharacterized protein YraI